MAAIGGPVVGVAGVFFGWLIAKGERTNALALARDHQRHEQQIARGTRLFEARARAYIDLLRQLRRAMMFVERTHPFIGPAPPPPEPASEDEWEQMYAQAAVYGSDELMEAFRAFHTKAGEFHVHAQSWERIEQRGGDWIGSRQAMDGAREEARQALDAIERRIREELAAL